MPGGNTLESVWQAQPNAETAIVEFGLDREFILSLATDSGDLLVGLTAALAELQADELGLLQVIFQPVQHPWAESMLRSVSDRDGKPFFANRPELVAAAQRKSSEPLYAAVIRIAAQSPDLDRAWAIVREMSAPLGGLALVGGNELIPLRNDGYPPLEHEEDVVRRQSRRCGMILNREELLALVHLPSAAVASPKLVREKGNSRPAPAAVRRDTGVLLGHNAHAGQTCEVRLSPEQRVRHTHIIGASGTGKSTLLFNLIRQDIEKGEGLGVLDPHGDLIDQVLGIIPAHRIDDVVLLDLSDEEYSVPFNILSAHSDLEKDASGFRSRFGVQASLDQLGRPDALGAE
ncbi:MAG: type IV secretion system DNA-binding domain-containing protein [Candidatus Moraniibacteriota bacterium]